VTAGSNRTLFTMDDRGPFASLVDPVPKIIGETVEQDPNNPNKVIMRYKFRFLHLNTEYEQVDSIPKQRVMPPGETNGEKGTYILPDPKDRKVQAPRRKES
jgi:hypothetical protein